MEKQYETQIIVQSIILICHKTCVEGMVYFIKTKTIWTKIAQNKNENA